MCLSIDLGLTRSDLDLLSVARKNKDSLLDEVERRSVNEEAISRMTGERQLKAIATEQSRRDAWNNGEHCHSTSDDENSILSTRPRAGSPETYSMTRESITRGSTTTGDESGTGESASSSGTSSRDSHGFEVDYHD